MMDGEQEEAIQAEELQVLQCPTRVYKGVLLFQNEIEQIETMDTFPDDIWMCSYPRSGTTLTQEMTYLVKTLEFQTALTSPVDERFPIIDIKQEPFPYWRGLCQALEMPRPRFIKTHIPYFLLPEQLRNGKGKIIYIVRDPADSVVSFFKLCRWSGLIESAQTESLQLFCKQFISGDQMIYGKWSSHVAEFWKHRNDSNMLFLRYEEVSTDRPTAIRKIANFLDQTITEDDVNKISEHCSVENMRKNPMTNQEYQRKYRKVFDEFGGFINTECKARCVDSEKSLNKAFQPRQC